MIRAMLRLLGFGRPQYRPIIKTFPHRAVLTLSSIATMRKCLEPTMQLRHEGIAYLFGQTDGKTTLIVGAIRPDARTTEGSFDVSAVAMANIVRKIGDAGLQLVGQIYSHPGEAYHSEGDEIGARISYDGFVSIVVPEYGRHLPDLKGSAPYFFADGRFVQLRQSAVTIIRDELP